jgi:AraC-like DNA-binding protein
MSYREIAPSPALREWIQCYWDRTVELAGPAVRVLPDCCADIIFDVSSGRGVAVGTMTRPLLVGGTRPALFGIRFQPGRAGAILRSALGEITDARIALRDVARFDCAAIEDRLAHVESTHDRVRIMETEMLMLASTTAPDRRVDEAIRVIEHARGVVDIDRVAEHVSTSRQHLARLFGYHVGVSAKSFSRIVRFRHALQLGGRGMPMANLALRTGYYDQSHFIADFRAFTGVTPVSFFLSRETTEV